MATSLASLREAVSRRLGDPALAIWSEDEITRHLIQAYDTIAQQQRVFWDWWYADNLPRGFSYTQPWEAEYLDFPEAFDYGCANYTAAFEAAYLPQEELIGPANHTCPDEITHFDAVGADDGISATSEVPENLTELSRAVWNEWGIDALSARDMRDVDSRYRETEGPVYGVLWELDGIRTIRKVRKPAEAAAVPEIDGCWGIVRRMTDLTADTASSNWGIPRRIPGQHPIGPYRAGTPRRFFVDGNNVRLEHWRQGQPMSVGSDVCELPDRYALYLRDYAQSECLRRAGPGQDLELAAHFEQRWQRGLTRIAARQRVVVSQRVGVMGGGQGQVARKPAPPVLPWNYGTQLGRG